MHIRNLRILLFIVISIFLSIYLTFNIFNETIIDNNINYINDNSINTTSILSNNLNNTTSISKSNYYMFLEIPKINLKRGIYNIESKYNNVNYNIELLKNSDDLIVLAAHSGNTRIAYFKRLDELTINDYVYLYKDSIKYKYVVESIDEVNKTGSVEISKDANKKMLVLITCKKNSDDKQLVFNLYLDS